jgi:acyl-CoA reductase-like NAD-dependent aldehyde dehydrogenase
MTLVLANLIDGRAQAPRAGRYLDVFEPAVGAAFARCPDSDASDVDAAVAAAQNAAAGWAATAPERRAQCLNRLADLVERELDALANWNRATPANRSRSRAASTYRARWLTCVSSQPRSRSGPASRTRATTTP